MTCCCMNRANMKSVSMLSLLLRRVADDCDVGDAVDAKSVAISEILLVSEI
jgi:hypothetical protein